MSQITLEKERNAFQSYLLEHDGVPLEVSSQVSKHLHFTTEEDIALITEANLSNVTGLSGREQDFVMRAAKVYRKIQIWDAEHRSPGLFRAETRLESLATMRELLTELRA